MKRAPSLLRLLCVVACLTASCTSGTGPADQPKVMVLGIDGGTWDEIIPMMEAGELPNLKKLYDGGLHGVLESRPPIMSPVVWTTIFTGFAHKKHGVRDWKTSQSVNRRVSAIWEILRERKMKADVFNVPGSFPPDPVPGVMLSGFPLSGATHGGNTGTVVTLAELKSGKVAGVLRDNQPTLLKAMVELDVDEWSPWLEGKIGTRPHFLGTLRVLRFADEKFYVTPLYRTDDGLVISHPKTFAAEISKKIGEPYIPEGPGWSRWAEEDTPAVLYAHLEQVAAIQTKAALEYVGGDWNLFLYVMTLVDRVSHPYWAYSHAEDFPDLDRAKAAKYETAVADSYRRSDEDLGKLLAGAKGEPYVLIVSDHGFQSARDKSKAVGAHNPDGIYLLSGPGISGRDGTRRYIEDITPTVLYLMNMPKGQDMDGKIFDEVVEMIGREPTSIPSYETAGRDATDEPVDSDTWESLKGLGYVDGAPPRAADRKKQAEQKDADKADKNAAQKEAQRKAARAKAQAERKAAQAKPEAGARLAPPPSPERIDPLADWPEEAPKDSAPKKEPAQP